MNMRNSEVVTSFRHLALFPFTDHLAGSSPRHYLFRFAHQTYLFIQEALQISILYLISDETFSLDDNPFL